MMRMKTKSNGTPPMNESSAGGGGGRGGSGNTDAWELRPGGMLVQKRTDADENQAPPPTIRVRVKYGSIYHQIHISSQATFGELKKMLTGPTGLHHQDQKLFYKDKERDSNAFLDTAGVKDKSKLVLTEDPISQEKRYLEMRKNAKMEKAAKSISEISLEVDRFGGQVSAFESVISKGGKVAEKDLVNLIELLMNQLLKLDGISADGDVKLQKKMQVKRVQKYVEILDTLKIKSSTPVSSGTSTQQNQQQKYSNGHVSTPVQESRYSNGSASSPVQQQQPQNPFGLSLMNSPPKQQKPPSTSGAFVITTKWETFDSAPAPLMAGAPSSSTVASRTINPEQSSFSWDLL
ncbi:BAG family molecular chaperone regulator 2-like [Olea europaea var. sylvestris]|uniref:BAG family molecular chaperone regulator 2-like n=1 Tax=Olea europaea var. sylvestris TaxID=158386 RepID=UPI000C1D5353|nr:BAG family molecular chaperone regulator 2-like [Olea europaea var. sylvestris]